MKKIFLSIMFIFIVAMMLSASVTYKNNGDGTYSAIITYKSDIYQANIIGSFINWQKPGVPMTKNADGVWEYTLLIDAPMVKYKFFDPAISDDSAYLDDPEAREKIANPFGSFDYLIRKKDAIALTSTPGDGGPPPDLEEEFNPVFGMWSMLYYNFQLYGDFGGKVVRDKNGDVVYVGTISGELKDKNVDIGVATVDDWKDGYVKEYDDGLGAGKVKHQVVDGDVGFGKTWGAWRFLGENGTTEGDYTRLILGRDSFSISSTLKFHGKVSKHFQVDVEVNSQLFWINANERWVWQGSKENREEWWKKRITSNVSNFVSGLFGGVGRDYVFPKQYFHNDAVGIDAGNSDGGRGSKFSGSDLDAGSMHVDQVQVCWTTDNFDIYVAPAGGKNFYSKDPMSLVSSTRIASSNYAQSSIQAFIHPSVVKGLNFNLATTYSAATKNYSGAGGADQIVSMVPDSSEVGRYIAAADIFYDVLGLNKYTIGFIYNMSALGVPGRMTVENQLKDYVGLQSFGNAVHELSIWTDLKPVKGLSIKFQGAMELDTRYWDAATTNKLNRNWFTSWYKPDDGIWFNEKGSYTGYDPLTTMADYVSVGYKNTLFDISVYQAAAGSRFRGNLAEYGSMFAGYMDIWSADFSNGIDGHGDLANKQGTIGGGLKFGISPIVSNPGLLKIRVDYDVRGIGIASPIFADASYRLIQESSAQKSGEVGEKLDMSKQWTLSNSWKPSFEVNLKLTDKMGMYIRAGAEFQLDTYFGQALIINENNNNINKVVDASTNIFTFREFDIRIGLTGIGDVLKAFEFQYHLTMRNQDPYLYGSPIISFDDVTKNDLITTTYQQTQEQYYDFNNKWAFKIMYHMIGAEFKFANDISLSAAYLLRYSRGTVSPISNTMISNKNLTAGADMPLVYKDAYKAAYYSIPDYFSWGLAFQFKYVIPVKILKTPTLFVNLNMGWDPSAYYDPGYLETIGFNTSSTNYDTSTGGDWNGHIHQFQMINLTLGLMWDF